MKKLEKLSAALQKISKTEQSFLFGGDSRCWYVCTTFTCVGDRSDRRSQSFDDDGNPKEQEQVFWDDDPCN